MKQTAGGGLHAHRNMASYSLEPLHSRPDLIEDTVKLLKDEYPWCRAERLKVLETPKCTGMPCSLVLIETREGAIVEVLGHVRIVQVHPPSEQRSYIESVLIKRSRRNQGHGRKLHQLTEAYVKNRFGSRYLHTAVRNELNRAYYQSLGFEEFPKVFPIAANVLQSYPYATWEGNVIPEEWKYLYEGGPIAPRDEKDKIIGYIKDLSNV